MENNYCNGILSKMHQFNFLKGCLILCLITVQLHAQVTVSGGLSGNGSYTTLGNAITAIGTAQAGANIIITVSGNTTEGAGTISIGAGTWTTLSIQPSGGARVISAATTAGLPMIDFNGADNVTINGLNSGGNSLTIQNTTVSPTAGTSTIRFQTDAINNTITNCFILGSSTMGTTTDGGNIWFGGAAISTGNDGNTISNCDIGPAGSNLPTKCIYGLGTFTNTTVNNSGINITNCKIHDFFNAAEISNGIYIANGNTDWNITGNRFYQSATRTQTTGKLHSPIQISNTSGNNFQITGNIIGFSNATGTGTYGFVGVSSSVLIPISLSVGVTVATSANNNLIAGITMTGSYSGTISFAPFRGIYISSGVTVCNGNTIGDLSTNGSISFSSSGVSAKEVIGMLNFNANNWTTNNNNIGGITAINTFTGAINITGLRNHGSSGKIWTCTNNVIGGSIANSINTASTSTATVVNGILNYFSGSIISGNTIRNMTSPGGTGTGLTASLGGIVINGALSAQSISKNIIHTLSNTNVSDAVSICGIAYDGPTSGTNLIESNSIHSLSIISSNASAELNGIYVFDGIATYRNNMIRLGLNSSGASLTNGIIINGINETANGTDNFYFNSVYIGGSAVAGSSNTYAFQSTLTGGTRNYRNNIFYNGRSNGAGAGKHYAVRAGGPSANPPGLTIDYNVYYANGTGGVFGFYNNIDRLDLAAWQTAVGQDVHSWNLDPQYLLPNGTAITGDLHINPSIATIIEGHGINIAAVIDDFDAQTRSTLTPEDIGADALNAIYFPACSGTPAASSIVGPNAVCPGSGTTLSLSTNFTDFGISYQWASKPSPGSPFINLGTASTQATGVLSGTTYFKCTITCSISGASYVTSEKEIGIGTFPTVSVSPTSGIHCSPGGGVTLTASGALSYSWSPVTGLTPTTGSPVIATPATNTTYTVIGTDVNGCTGSATASVIVIPASIGSASSNSPVCTGNALNLSSGGGTNYNWTGPNGFTSTQQNPIILNASSPNSGTYTVSIIDGDLWTQKSNVGGGLRWGAVGFSIGSKGYVGTGTYGLSVSSFKKDFWEFDPVLNTWTQKADFGGTARYLAVGFSIGTKGYLGTGWQGSTGVNTRDFWEYDPSLNLWTQKANFGGLARQAAVGFSIGTKGYIGCGVTGGYVNDFWEYNPTLDSWTSKASFGGLGRVSAVGFSIGTKGYIGTGQNSLGNLFQDFWEYDPSINTWTQKANFGGTARESAVGFSIGARGYIGTGNDGTSVKQDFWEYTPVSNSWIQKADFAGNIRASAIGFSIGTNGYLGTGDGAGAAAFDDFWEYTPGPGSLCPSVVSTTAAIFPIPTVNVSSNSPVCSGSTLNLTSSGGTSYSWTGPNGFTSAIQNPVIPNVTVVNTGTYTVSVTDANGCMSSSSTVVSLKSLPSPSATSNSPVCTGKTLNLSSSGGISYSWTGPFLFTSTQQNPSETNFFSSKAGNYVVTVTGASGCTASATAIVVESPLPTAIPNSNSPLCSGSTLNLTAGGGVSFSWTGPNGFASLLQNPVLSNVTSLNAGSYQVTVSDANGCTATDNANVVIHTYTPATATSNSPVCSGSSINLSSSGGSGYSWTGPNGFTSSLQNPVISNASVINAGIYSVSVTNPIWTFKSTFTNINRTEAVGFSIGNKGYIGTGNNSGVKQDFWEFDPGTNTWTQKANFGGVARARAVGFSIGNKGYIGLGTSGTYLQDFWEYDPVLNVWTQKSNFGGVARSKAVSFSIGAKGYVGTGYDGTSLKQDFWEYDPSNDTWTQKANFGGSARLSAAGFSIGSKGYIGTGNDFSSLKQDFWEYDPLANSWTQKANFSGTGRQDAVGFNIGSKGYIGTGDILSSYKKDFWEYDPGANLWTQKEDISGIARRQAIGFSIGNKGYIGTGSGTGLNYASDFLEYDPYFACPSSASTIVNVFISSPANASSNSPVCSGNTMNLFSSGGSSYNWTGPNGFTSAQQNPSIVNVTSSGIGDYVVIVTGANGCTSSATTSVMVNAIPTFNAISNSPVCLGSTLNLYSSGGTSYSWTGPNGFISTQQNPVIPNVALVNTGNYIATVTGSNGCTASSSTTVAITLSNTYYADADGDGYGVALYTLQGCAPIGFFSATVAGDCNDGNSAVHPGATEVCFNGIDDNCNGTTDEFCNVTLHLRVLIEGFYLGSGLMQATVDPVVYPSLCDTMVVVLRNAVFPYNVAHIDTSVIDTNGYGDFTFPSGASGGNFYIVLRHRNAIETWSASPVLFNTLTTNYNFTTAKTQAYGSNLRDLGDGKFALWSGDISDAATGTVGIQDGVMESQDYGDMESAVYFTLLGYKPQDITGDGVVESSDYGLMESNVYFTIFSMKP